MCAPSRLGLESTIITLNFFPSSCAASRILCTECDLFKEREEKKKKNTKEIRILELFE